MKTGPRRTTLLFVYGTLMRGEEHHRRLGASTFVGVARTAARYALADLGEYPALLEEGDQEVVGELYRVDAATLRRLDRFEGHPELYRRVAVELAAGGAAQAYLATDVNLARTKPRIDGDWRRHRTSRRVSRRFRDGGGQR